MNQPTVLILDGQHRGGILERGLTGRNYHVFRTTRSREASKLLHVLQPSFLVVAMEGDGLSFYQQFVLTGQVGAAKCVVLSLPGTQGLRPVDHFVDSNLPSARLLDEVVRCIHSTAGTQSYSSIGSANDDKTMMQLQPIPKGLQGSRQSQAHLEDDQTIMQLQPIPTGITQGSSSSHPSIPSSREPMQSASSSSKSSLMSGAGLAEREWSGTLDKLDVARILSILTRQQASGRLDFHRNNDIRSVWLERGKVILVLSRHPLPALAKLLVRDGVLQQHDVEMHPEFGSLDGAKLLAEMGKVQPDQIPEVERWYIEQILLATFQWEYGDFRFSPGKQNKVQGRVKLATASLILEGVRATYDIGRLSDLLGGADRVPQWFANRNPENFLPLQSQEKHIVDMIDGERTLHEILNASGSETRALLSLIYVLMILGYVRMKESVSSSSLGSALGQPPFSSRTPSMGPPTPSSDQTDEVMAARASEPHTMEMDQAAPDSLDTGGLGSHSFGQAEIESSERSGRQRPTAPNPVPLEILSEEMKLSLKLIEGKFKQVIQENYFQILELTPEAQEVEIRRAYQRIKHTFMPERFANVVAVSMEKQLFEIKKVLEEAYAVLSDPQLRFGYMSHLAEAS